MSSSVLPHEVVLIVLSFSTPQTVCRCEQSCRTWFQLVDSHDTSIWRSSVWSKVHHQLSYCSVSGGEQCAVTTLPGPVVAFMQNMKLVKGETWRDVVRMWTTWSRPSLAALRSINQCSIVYPQSSTGNSPHRSHNPFQTDVWSKARSLTTAPFLPPDLSSSESVNRSAHIDSNINIDIGIKAPLILLSSLSTDLPLSRLPSSPEGSLGGTDPSSMSTTFQQVKIARIGMGTISLPTLFVDENAGSASSPPKQHLWFDNGGQIMRGLDVSAIPSPTQSSHTASPKPLLLPNRSYAQPSQTPFRVVLPYRPLGVSVQLIAQVRSDLLILQELIPGQRSVTIRIWDPRLHPNGPWMPSEQHHDRLHGSDTLEPHTITDGHGHRRVRGLWVLPFQTTGASLCGHTLICRVHSSVADEDNPFPHTHGVVCWKLEDAIAGLRSQDDAMPLYRDSYGVGATQQPDLSATFPSPTLSPPSSPVRIIPLLPSPMRIVWKRTLTYGLVQEIISNELVVAVRILAIQNQHPPAQDEHRNPPAQDEHQHEPHHPLDPPSHQDTPAMVQLWSIGTGSLFADITGDIPRSFLHGSGIFRIQLIRFHLVLYNTGILAVFDVLQSRRAWFDQRNRSGHCHHSTIDPRCQDRHPRSTRVISGLCSISKIPFVGHDVRIDISNDATTVVIAPAHQRGEVIVLDMKRSTCTTYLVNDGFSEGAQSRHGSMAGRHCVGVWFISDQFENGTVNGRRHTGVSRSSSHTRPSLSVAWQSIPV
ncbi:hypothetical protein BASA60_008473 [Batrachochytrium salamandrivorans]|nr:hypothetical protein BASA60_008473 [Batrachochytrium salamandrivorans]KAH9273160.1 hypothetical protein BASA83_004449 [Batrachochytrium salamandrivorans]